MFHAQARNINNLFIKVCRALNNRAPLVVREQKTKEICNVTLTLLNPDNSIVTLEPRKLSMKYVAAETLWYLLGDPDVTIIGSYAKLWNDISDTANKANSNYGHHAFYQKLMNGKTQFQYVIEKLREDMHTRKAVINFNQLNHKAWNPKDFPCTMYAHFTIRHNYLNMYIAMRSNDLIYGYSNDAPFFSLLHRIVFRVLEKTYPTLKLGFYVHFTNSMHVYEKHFDMIQECASRNIKKDSPYFLIVDDAFIKDISQGTYNSQLMRYLLDVSKYPVKKITVPWLGKLFANSQ